jgi:hypothetical protein
MGAILEGNGQRAYDSATQRKVVKLTILPPKRHRRVGLLQVHFGAGEGKTNKSLTDQRVSLGEHTVKLQDVQDFGSDMKEAPASERPLKFKKAEEISAAGEKAIAGAAKN